MTSEPEKIFHIDSRRRTRWFVWLYKSDSLYLRLCRYVQLEIGSDSAQTVSLIYKATCNKVVTQFRLLLEHLMFRSLCLGANTRKDFPSLRAWEGLRGSISLSGSMRDNRWLLNQRKSFISIQGDEQDDLYGYINRIPSIWGCADMFSWKLEATQHKL